MDGGTSKMINLTYEHGLLFSELKVKFKDKELILDKVLIDTGSGGTILKTDRVFEIGIEMEPTDQIETIRGVGGSEFVFIKTIEELSLGGLNLNQFKCEIGAMDYGIEMDGIIGLDFLKEVGAIIDLEKMEIRSA